MENELSKTEQPCTIHSVVRCALCLEKQMQDEMQHEILEEEAWHHRMNDMYTYTDDGFCDGFTKW
jgi:hypothetical protein